MKEFKTWIIQLIRDFLILDYKSAFFIIEFIFEEQIKYHKTFKCFEQNKMKTIDDFPVTEINIEIKLNYNKTLNLSSDCKW